MWRRNKMASNLEARSILQGLFDKWNGKSKEVINEAKVEDVQTTIITQPPKLYKLTYGKQGGDRYQVKFGNYHLCTCYTYEKEQVEEDFNNYKMGGYSTSEIAKYLKSKYNLRNKRHKEYSFTRGRGKKQATGRTVAFNYSFDGRLHEVCHCRNHYKTKAKVVEHCRELVSQGKSLEEVRIIMRPLYSSNKKNSLRYIEQKQKKVDVPEAPMRWNSNGRLLFYGNDTNLTPYNLDVICSLHANYDNPFTFGDYVLQNLPRALPSAVFYLCENYDMIPKLSSEGKKILDKR